MVSGTVLGPDWRDAAAYDAIAAGGRYALGWEVLRRDPAYVGFASAALTAEEVPARGSGTAADWGLHFR